MPPPRRASSKDTPAKLAKRMGRRWRVVLLRAKGEILRTVDPMRKRRKLPPQSSSNWMRFSAIASWCRSWVKPGVCPFEILTP